MSLYPSYSAKQNEEIPPLLDNSFQFELSKERVAVSKDLHWKAVLASLQEQDKIVTGMSSDPGGTSSTVE